MNATSDFGYVHRGKSKKMRDQISKSVGNRFAGFKVVSNQHGIVHYNSDDPGSV